MNQPETETLFLVTSEEQQALDTDLLRSLGARTLYVHRPLLNHEQFSAWAKSQGFKTTLGEEAHVTIAYSKKPVLWDTLTPDTKPLSSDFGMRGVKPLGDGGAIVMWFEDPQLEQRWKSLCEAGCSWDYESYQPHITITWEKPEDLDLDKVQPFDEALLFGPEVFAELDEDWKDTIVEKFDPNQPRHPKGVREGGRWAKQGGLTSAGFQAQAHKEWHAGRGWIARGIQVSVPDEGIDIETAKRIEEGTATVEDLLPLIHTQDAGIFWYGLHNGTEGGSVRDAQEFAYNEDGPGSSWWNGRMQEPEEGKALFIGTGIVMVAKRPKGWTSEDNPDDGLMGNSYIDTDRWKDTELEWLRYQTRNNQWIDLPVKGVKVRFSNEDEIQKFDPNQPRAPKGTSEGGQWVRQGWGDSTLATAELHGVGNPALMETFLPKLHQEVRAFVQRLPLSDEANIISRTRFESMLPPPAELARVLPDGTPRANPINTLLGTAGGDPLQDKDTTSHRYLIVYNDYLLRDKRVLAALPNVREHTLIHEIGHVVDYDSGAGLEAARLGLKHTWFLESIDAQKTLMEDPSEEARNALRVLSDVTHIWSEANRPERGHVELTADLYTYLRGASNIRGIPRAAFRRIFPKTIEIYTQAFQNTVRDFEPLEPVMPPPLYKAEMNLSAIPGWWQGYTMGPNDELVRLRPVRVQKFNKLQPRHQRGTPWAPTGPAPGRFAPSDAANQILSHMSVTAEAESPTDLIEQRRLSPEEREVIDYYHRWSYVNEYLRGVIFEKHRRANQERDAFAEPKNVQREAWHEMLGLAPPHVMAEVDPKGEIWDLEYSNPGEFRKRMKQVMGRWVEQMDSALAKLTLGDYMPAGVNEVPLYRGIKYPDNLRNLKKMQVGDEISDSGFSTFTMSPWFAYSFGGPMRTGEGQGTYPIFRVQGKRGMHGHVSSFESQVILPRETKYRITNIRDITLYDLLSEIEEKPSFEFSRDLPIRVYDIEPVEKVRKEYNPAQPRWPAGSGDKSGQWRDSDAVPPAPGTAPVPEGALRVYHYTDDLSAVLASGLQRSKAKGHTYGEPDVVWASAQRPGNHKEYVEFYVYPFELGIGREIGQERFTPEQVQAREAYGSDVTLLGDLPPERIISYHQRWHDTYRYLSESPEKIMEVLRGDHDGITKDDFPDEYRAIQLLKKQYTLQNGEVVRKFDPNQPRHPKGTSEGGRWSKGKGTSLWASVAADPQREKFEALARNNFNINFERDFDHATLVEATRNRFEYLRAFVQLVSTPGGGFDAYAAPYKTALEKALSEREARRQAWIAEHGGEYKEHYNEQEAINYFANVLETELRFPPLGKKGGDRNLLWAVPAVANTLKELKDKGWGMPRGVDMGMWWHEGLTPGISYAKELVAMYTGFDMLHVNAPMFRDLAHLEAACNDDSFLVSSGPKLGLRGAILHEMIHRRDSQDRMSEGGLWGSDLEALRGAEWSKRKMTYADYPSVYSMSNANDFVAEMGVAMYLNSTISQNAMDLYQKLDGPKI